MIRGFGGIPMIFKGERKGNQSSITEYNRILQNTILNRLRYYRALGGGDQVNFIAT